MYRFSNQLVYYINIILILCKYFPAGPKQLGDTAGIITSCKRSLHQLRTNYLDLLLVHWPARQQLDPQDPQHSSLRRNTWTVFQDLHSQVNTDYPTVSCNIMITYTTWIGVGVF